MFGSWEHQRFLVLGCGGRLTILRRSDQATQSRKFPLVTFQARFNFCGASFAGNVLSVIACIRYYMQRKKHQPPGLSVGHISLFNSFWFALHLFTLLTVVKINNKIIKTICTLKENETAAISRALLWNLLPWCKLDIATHQLGATSPCINACQVLLFGSDISPRQFELVDQLYYRR